MLNENVYQLITYDEIFLFKQSVMYLYTFEERLIVMNYVDRESNMLGR